MEKNKFIIFMLFKITIFLNFIIQTSLQESCNDLLKTNKCFSNYCSHNPNTKECPVNNILIIENTNGDIYLNQDLSLNAIMFGTTLSNNENRIFYGFIYDYLIENYFNYENIYLPQKISIERSERKEIKNAELALYYMPSNFILLLGSDNSFIEIYEISDDLNNLSFEPTYFLGENIIIKGKPSLLKFTSNNFYFVGITSTEENSGNYNISFYEYKSDRSNAFYNSMEITAKNHFETEIKGEYISCDSLNYNPFLISCFYLTEDNKYTVILVKKENDTFIMSNKILVEQKEDINLEKPYFMKALLFTIDFCIYAYYSGESNDIPTFLIKTISQTDYSIKNAYNDFPVVYLYDYKFNNGIEYNDLATNENDEFFFISTEKDKENIIISYIKFYLSSDNKEQLLIRYYIIPLKQNYNMKILNGFKAIYFNSYEEYIPFLTFGFNFCFNGECDKLNNAGLIMLSFPGVLNGDKLDFIEYAIKYNTNYTIMNLTEIFGIQNNIFGYSIDYFEFDSSDNNIEIMGINGESPANNIDPSNPMIKVILNDNIFKISNIEFVALIYASLPDTIEKFNENCNKINDTFGDKNDISSYSLNKGQKNSHYIYYKIVINEELSNECNITDCDLCLKKDLNYCIICKDDNYYIIEDQKYRYGKLKICHEKMSDIVTNDITEKKIDELTNKITNDLTYEITDKRTDEIKDTDKKTEVIINTITEKITNKDETNYITSNIDTQKLINDLTNKIKINELSNNTQISFEELMNDKYKNVSLSNEEIEEIYKHIKDYITENYDGNNTIINSSNVKIQISKIDDQKDSELSNIDLGDCEEILKNKYCKTENDSLIMLKFDIRPENETSTFVHYEVYSTREKLYLELEECSGNNVIINVPIELSSEMEELYEFLSQSGYNIFDSNSSFYNDICASFTTQNGTDILLYDRRMDIYRTTLNISLCQEGCDFHSYDIETKKAKCDCYSQKKDLSIEDLSDIKFDKNQMIEDFYQTIQNSNFRVLKCYKLVFNFKIFIKNIGSIGMSVLLALFNILIIIHLTLGSAKINSFIQTIIKNKYLENENRNKNPKNIEEMKSKENEINKKNNLENEVKNKTKNKNKRKKRISVIFNKNIGLEKLRDIKRKKTSINLDNKNAPPKRKSSNYKNVKNKGNKADEKYLSSHKNNNYNLISSKMVTLSLNEKSSNDWENSPKAKRKSKNKKLSKKFENELIVYHKGSKDSENNRLNHKRSTIIHSPKRSKSKKLTKKLKNLLIFSKDEETSTRLKNKTLEKNNLLNSEKASNLNTQELNTLKYEEALELDKRTYFQYYYSLLKKKHLILFTFLPTNDYNLMSLKIALFIVSFSMYFTIETFFFNDETMHKIYQESGVYNILTQIPQILYSSVVSSIINMILKTLSLSEKDILKIKKEKNVHSTVKLSKSIEKCIKIKSFLFFTLSLLLMLFFWYFISCFCAVYYNTQVILIKNTLLSFSLSMLYPIGINLIPGMFRIPALRAEKKDKKCLYSFSQFVALI